MKKKIANIIELAVLLATFVILCTSTVVVYSAQKSAVSIFDYESIGILTLMSDGLLIYPMYFFYVMIALMCIISIVTNNKHKDGKLHSFLPVLWFISVNVNLALVGGHVTTWRFHSFDGFPIKLFEILAVGVMVIGFAKRSSIIAGVTEEKAVNAELSKADELAKFKELLDKGVITQEEYNKKKKQILK